MSRYARGRSKCFRQFFRFDRVHLTKNIASTHYEKGPSSRHPEFRFEQKRWNDNEVERKWQRQGWVNGTRRDTRLLTTTTTTVRPVIEITNRSAWPRSHDDVRIYVSTNHVYDANRIEDSRNIKASVRLRRGVLRSPFYTRISRTCFTSTYREENGHRIMSTTRYIRRQ